MHPRISIYVNKPSVMIDQQIRHFLFQVILNPGPRPAQSLSLHSTTPPRSTFSTCLTPPRPPTNSLIFTSPIHLRDVFRALARLAHPFPAHFAAGGDGSAALPACYTGDVL